MNIMLDGERIYLRLFDIEDVETRMKWMNDKKFREMLNSPYPVSMLSTQKWLNYVTEDKTRIDLAVCLKKNHKLIGYTGFRDIDFINRKAESYTGIGKKDYWGKGLGKEIKILSLKYIFNIYDLNKIYVKVRVDHKTNIELNKKIGFNIDGVLRKEVYSHGEYRDIMVMSLLKSEFYHNQLA